MRRIRVLFQRMRSVFFKRQSEQSLSEEFTLHVDQLTEQYKSQGLSESAAHAAALREFGPVEAAKERCRDMQRMNWWHDFARDTLYASRSLIRSPAFSLATILTIALGIGVNTAVFSLVHSVLLDPLPYFEADRLVHIAETHPERPLNQVAAPDFVEWQRTATSFQGLGAYTFQAVNKWTIIGHGEPELVQVVQASQGLFELLGIEPLLGRTYSVAEEQSKAPVVIISESLWRRKYNADPNILGRKIQLIEPVYTVIGVARQSNAHPGWADIWMPISFLDPALTESRRFRALEVVARLKPGITIERAQSELNRIAANVAREYPDTNSRVGVSVLPMASWLTGEVRPSLISVWAAVSLVLLLACANVAHLVLVRTGHRFRELGLRAALGAGTTRLVRFLLAEAFLLAAMGGLLGLVLAGVCLPLMLHWLASPIPGLSATSISPAALSFGLIATCLVGLIFAAPAILKLKRIELNEMIMQGPGFALGHRTSSIGRLIIAAEITLAFLVLNSTTLLYRSYEGLLHEKTGFVSHNVVAAEIPLALSWDQSAAVFEQRVAPALRAIPGVRSVAAVNCAPMMLRPSEAARFTGQFGVAGRELGLSRFAVAQVRWLTADYFRTLQIPLKRGRLFTEQDIGRKGFIVNETFARRYFPHLDPIGKQLLYNIAKQTPDRIPIVGVVGDVRDLSLHVEPSPTLYSLGVSNRMTVLIASDTDTNALIPAVRKAIQATTPDAAIGVLAPLDRIVQNSIDLRRFSLTLFSLFSILAVLLTVVGVYGVMNYALGQRVRDIAIRYAMGADRAQIHRQILGGFAMPVIGGLLGGTLLSYVCAEAIRSELYKMHPGDPWVFGACGVSIVLLLGLAVLHPLSKAASISPIEILRQ